MEIYFVKQHGTHSLLESANINRTEEFTELSPFKSRTSTEEDEVDDMSGKLVEMDSMDRGRRASKLEVTLEKRKSTNKNIAARSLLSGTDDDVNNVQGLRLNLTRRYLYLLFGIASCGLLFMICAWNVVWRQKICYDEVSSIQESTHVLAKTEDEEVIEEVKIITVDGKSVRYVEIKCKKYIETQSGDGQISALPELPENYTELFLKDTDGPKDDYLAKKVAMKLQYGPNTIDIPMKLWINYFFIEASKPFYCFQYFACGLWVYELYFSYSLVILTITMTSIIIVVTQEYSNKLKMKRLASLSREQDFVDRRKPVSDEGFVPYFSSASAECVPGDYVIIRTGQIMTCDVVIIQGECIVDENVLTGETLPVRKVAFEKALINAGVKYNPGSHGGYTLFSGTTVKLTQGAQTREGSTISSGVVGIVCRTGFFSAKGQLIRAIMFPKHHDLQYSKDALIFIFMMAIGGSLFYIWSAALMIGFGAESSDIFVKFLDMIAIAVPPALTCALSIGVSVSVARLAEVDVSVSDSERVTWAGLTSSVCFDKTGTLTESGLDFHGVVPGTAKAPVNDMKEVSGDTVEVLATCHGLSLLGQELVGDPLEIRLIKSSNSTLAQVPSAKGVDCIITNDALKCSWQLERRFDFTSEKMRSGVVVLRNDGRRMFHAKGSPEAIKKIVDPASLPSDFTALLNSFTRQGLRVLAFASRPMGPSEDFSKCADQIPLEKGLRYGGLILLANKLKSESKQTITDLRNADIHVAMITGDHVRTAVSVSYDCGILDNGRDTIIVDLDDSIKTSGQDLNAVSLIAGSSGPSFDFEKMPVSCVLVSQTAPADEKVLITDALKMIAANKCNFAITGRALRLIADFNPYAFSFLVGKGKVFARMEPEDKSLVVETLGHGVCTAIEADANERTFYTSFCGDGANDIAALKSAMVGVSLCDTDASVAAPLTAKGMSPFIMVKILMEGRNALIGSFVIFKYIMVYAMVQVFSTCILYSVGVIYGNNQYLVQDLIFTTVLAAAMSFTRPLNGLPAEVPPERFLTREVIVPVMAHFIVVIVFQVIAMRSVQNSEFLQDDLYHATNWFDSTTNTTLTACAKIGDFQVVNGVENKNIQCVTADDVLDINYTYENTAVFIMSLFQYVMGALIMDQAKPFRKYWFTNPYQVIAITAQLSILLYLILYVPVMPPGCKSALLDNSGACVGWGSCFPHNPRFWQYDWNDFYKGDGVLPQYASLTPETLPFTNALDIGRPCPENEGGFCPENNLRERVNATLSNEHCIAAFASLGPTYCPSVKDLNSIKGIECLLTITFKDYFMDTMFQTKQFPDVMPGKDGKEVKVGFKEWMILLCFLDGVASLLMDYFIKWVLKLCCPKKTQVDGHNSGANRTLSNNLGKSKDAVFLSSSGDATSSTKV